MKITCQSCQSKYNVADEKVQGKIVKIRCRKCGATIVVQANGETVSNGASASRGPTPPPSAGADAQWHVNLGEGEPRTMSVREIVDAYNAGVVVQDTLLWTDGMDDWKPLSEIDAVVAALHASAGAADAGAAGGHDDPPPPAPAPEPAFPSPRVPDSAPPGDDAPTAIGSFAMLAQQQAEAPVEPKRAAVKREPRSRDLFASRVATEEMVQTSAPAAAQLASSRGGGLGALEEAGPKLTGERNENSVLFSLAVLTKDAERASGDAKAAEKGAGSEDSGLIDLKALAAKAESIRPAAVIADGAVFAPPLGAIAPLGAPLGAVGVGSGDDRPRSLLPLIIGGGAGALVLGVLCVFVGMKLAGSGNAAAAVAASAVASASRAPVAATVEPSATASAAPPAASASASAEEKPAAAPKPRPVYHAPAKHEAAPASHETTGAPAAPAPKAAPKKTSDCGCNGDLMCLMKCSTH